MLPVSPDAKVTMSLHDYQAVERLLEELRAKVVALESQLPLITSLDPGQDLHAALQDALPIIRFAVANLPPEMHAGWPIAELGRLSALLERLYPHEPDLQTLVIAFRTFADEVAEIEAMRVQRRAGAAQILAELGDRVVSQTVTLKSDDLP